MKLDSKYFDCIRVKPERESTAGPELPSCQWQGCSAPAEHRAPQGRGREGAYFRFCLEHVRAYNSTYNYFAGMSDAEVEAYQKSAVTGHRPTWQFARGDRLSEGREEAMRSTRTRAAQAQSDIWSAARDFFEFRSRQHGGDPRGPAPKLGNMARKSLRALNLDDRADKVAIKSRFKELVKRHHPDSNGGDRGSEDRLREIIQAYNYLKQAGLC